MSKRWLSGRPRAPSHDRPDDNPSSTRPSLPRTRTLADIQPWNADTSTTPHHLDRPQSRRSCSERRAELDRPRTAGGALQSHSQTKPRHDRQLATSRSFDSPTRHSFGTQVAMQDTNPATAVAQGSPDRPKPSNKFHQAPVTQNQRLQQGNDVDVNVQPKSHRWKRLGGLFRTKSTSTESSDTPHNYQMVDNTGTTEWRPPPLPKDGPLDDVPMLEHFKSTSHGAQRTVLVRKETTHVALENGQCRVPVPEREDSLGLSAVDLRSQLPKLDVRIPDVHMERYSVMFGSLLGNQPSRTLLARRSKVLESLKTSSSESSPASDKPDQTLKDDATLKPPTSSRRATSPTPGKSPMFSLFPQSSLAQKKIIIKAVPVPRSPLQRSFTAPSRLSPMQESFTSKPVQPTKPYQPRRRDSTVSLLETSASTSQGPSWSTDGSFLSPSSSISSLGDGEILFDVRKLSMVSETQEPQYEMTKADGAAIELYRSQSQKLRNAKALHKASPPPLTAELPKLAQQDIGSPITSIPQPQVSLAIQIPSTMPHDTPKERSRLGKEVQRAVPLVAARVQPQSQNLGRLEEADVHAEANAEAEAQAEAETEVQTDEPNEIIAAAVQETLDYMEVQSVVRAASPMPHPVEEKSATPSDKPVKLLTIPKNIPISKYAIRSPSPYGKAAPEERSRSPQPTRTTQEASPDYPTFAQRAAKLQASSASKHGLEGKRTSPQTAKALPAHPTAKPDLRITAPKTLAGSDKLDGSVSPAEVAVARQVSLSRKQSKKLQIPPSRRPDELRPEHGERMVERHALTPAIHQADKAHRPGKSVALIIENV